MWAAKLYLEGAPVNPLLLKKCLQEWHQEQKALTHPTREIRFLSLSEMCSLDSSECSWQTSLGRQWPVMVASTCFLSPPPPAPDPTPAAAPSLFTLPLLSLQLQAIRSAPQLERMKRARTRKAMRVLVSNHPSSTIPCSNCCPGLESQPLWQRRQRACAAALEGGCCS